MGIGTGWIERNEGNKGLFSFTSPYLFLISCFRVIRVYA